MRTIQFSQGWTVEIQADAPSVYLEWIPTGSIDPNLPDLYPWEAREFAAALIEAAERAERGETQVCGQP